MSILLDSITREAITPALKLLPRPMDTYEARIMLLAIGLQESEFMYRYQKLAGGGKGPARSFWQFERPGGVRGIMRHSASRFWVNHLCAARGCLFDEYAIWNSIEEDGVLAAGCARLLLFTDAAKLPGVNASHEEAWQYYFRNWRPGKPHREKWDAYHSNARAYVTGTDL